MDNETDSAYNHDNRNIDLKSPSSQMTPQSRGPSLCPQVWLTRLEVVSGRVGQAKAWAALATKEATPRQSTVLTW